MQEVDVFASWNRLATWIVVVDSDCKIQFANAALCDGLGYTLAHLKHKNFGHWVDVADQLHASVQQAVSDSPYSTVRFDAHVLCAHGQPMAVHVVIGSSEDKQAVVVEMLPADSQARQERDARLASQVAAHKELIRNLAHEIRNPLGGLRGAAQLLHMELPDAALHTYTQVIIKEADRLQALVDRMLAPHQTAQQLAPTNIHTICEHVRTVVLAEFPQGLTIARDYDVSIPDMQADQDRVTQAVLNIVRNAAQALRPFTPESKAKITLRTRVARQLTIGRKRIRLALELQVIDNGPGIAPDMLEQVFYPLVTGKADGTGLGLTLAQTYIQQHHGMIVCDSVPGRTVFTVLLPLQTA